jgi:hypothetical protein
VAYSLLDDVDVGLQGVFLVEGFDLCGSFGLAIGAEGVSLPTTAALSEWSDDVERHCGGASRCSPNTLGGI